MHQGLKLTNLFKLSQVETLQDFNRCQVNFFSCLYELWINGKVFIGYSSSAKTLFRNLAYQGRIQKFHLSRELTKEIHDAPKPMDVVLKIYQAENLSDGSIWKLREISNKVKIEYKKQGVLINSLRFYSEDAS